MSRNKKLSVVSWVYNEQRGDFMLEMCLLWKYRIYPNELKVVQSSTQFGFGKVIFSMMALTLASENRKDPGKIFRSGKCEVKILAQ